MIRQTANAKSQWTNTILQGKGYEWDFMNALRNNPTNILSTVDAGTSPTQPGIDITQKDIFGNIETFQNKAYLSTNKPELHNTPKDAIVITNAEKVQNVKNQGYNTKSFQDADKIKAVRDSRFKQGLDGKANPTYTVKNFAVTCAQAGVIGAAISMTVETVASYKAWKNGHLTDEQYLKEVLKAGGEGGITGVGTAAVMIPINAAIAAAGASTLIGIPIAFAIGGAINYIVGPIFGRGKYREILNEAKYYQAIEDCYDDFIAVVEHSSNAYYSYISQMQRQAQNHEQMKYISSMMKEKSREFDIVGVELDETGQILDNDKQRLKEKNKEIDGSLKNLLDSI